MKIIIPRPLTLISSNIPEPDIENGDPAEHDMDTTYPVDSTVSVVETHKIYKALSENTGVYPPSDTLSDSPKWAAIDVVNRWKALDSGIDTSDISIAQINSQSVQSGEITYTVDASMCSAVGLFNIQAEKVTVSIKDNVTDELLEGPFESVLADLTVSDWFGFFFAPIRMRRNSLRSFGVGYGQNIEIKVESSDDAVVKVGTIIVGLEEEIGKSKSGIETSFYDFSVKEEDSYGRVSYKKGLLRKVHDLSIYAPTDSVTWLENLMDDLRATIVAWISDNVSDINNAREDLVVLGAFKGWKKKVERKNGITECFISLEGLP